MGRRIEASNQLIACYGAPIHNARAYVWTIRMQVSDACFSVLPSSIKARKGCSFGWLSAGTMAFDFCNQQVIYRTQPGSFRQAMAISLSPMVPFEALGYKQPGMVLVYALDVPVSSTDVSNITGHRLAIHSRPEPQTPLRFPWEATSTQSSTR